MIILIRALHTGAGYTDSKSAQHFDSKKLSQIVLVLQTGFKLLAFGSRVGALPIEPPHHPYGTDGTKKNGNSLAEK